MLFRALTVAALSSCLFVAHAPASDIVRESTGKLRADLDRMELTNFPAEHWSKLAAWANGDALTPAALEGKAVMVVTWASWHPASLKVMSIAQSAAAKYGPQGLIVVGVHNKEGWNEAASVAKARGITFLLAHDASGEFRKSLKIDHDPMFYFFDRAGHLRYAAVSSASVDEASAELVKETREQANDLPRIRREREDAEAGTKRRTSEINKTIDLSTLPAVPPGYVHPQASDYKNVAWPKMDTELAKKVGLYDETTKKFKEVKLAFTPPAYYPAKPEIQGRAIVIYVWHPDVTQSYAKVMPQMDELQTRYERDLAVIGAAISMKTLRPNGQQVEEESLPKLAQKYANFIQSRKYSHALAPDFQGTSLAPILGSGGGSGDGFPLPGAMVVSSDGIIRWIGWSDGPDFKYAIETIVAVDPAVKARRAADRAFIEAKSK